MHSLATLELVTHKVLSPSNTVSIFEGQTGFNSIGIADDKLYGYFMSSLDTQLLLILNTTNLSVMKFWETGFSNAETTSIRWWSIYDEKG